MTQIFTAEGERIPVTVVEVPSNTIVSLRTLERDGYTAVQVGLEEAKEKHTNKAMKGHFEKHGVPAFRILQEFRVSPEIVEAATVGSTVDLDIFEVGMKVDVTSTSKGKGFQGVMKRHHMSGMQATHGTHEKRRNVGSIGNRKTPGRTFKNKRLPGHMGDKRVTIQNIKVAEMDLGERIILLAGTVPGARGALVTIRPAVKGQGKSAV